MISRSLSRSSFGTSSPDDVTRRERGDLHREVACKRGVAALDLDEHADARAVHVAADRGAALDDVETAHGDVLADLRHELEPQIFHGSAVDGAAQQRFDARGALAQHDVRQLVDERAEVVVLGDEVGLRVDLEHDVAARLLVAANHDATLGRDARGLLVGLRGTGLAQPLGREIDVALGFDQRFLAFHHAGAGALAQFLDQGRFDFHSRCPLTFVSSRLFGLGLFFGAFGGCFLAGPWPHPSRAPW